MKKKKINKLSLNKSAISNLDEVSGGLAAEAASNPCVVSNPRSACATKCVTNCGWTCPALACVASGILFC
jgi:hypothetical protein